MSIFTKLGVSVAAPFNADGTPRQISPQDFQIWMTEVERLIKGLISNAGGIDLPDLIYKYVITGGDENNIIGQPNATPPTAAGEALFTIEITQPNTGHVTINDKPLLTSSGNEIVAGGLVPGVWLFLDDGANFRLVSDQASQAIMNAVESALLASQEAQQSAEDARDIAIEAAGNAVAQGNVPIYSTLTAISSLEIPAGINAIRVNGRNSVGDGQGGLYVDTDNGSTDTVLSADGRTWYHVRDVGENRLTSDVIDLINSSKKTTKEKWLMSSDWQCVPEDAAQIAYQRNAMSQISSLHPNIDFAFFPGDIVDRASNNSDGSAPLYGYPQFRADVESRMNIPWEHWQFLPGNHDRDGTGLGAFKEAWSYMTYRKHMGSEFYCVHKGNVAHILIGDMAGSNSGEIINFVYDWLENQLNRLADYNVFCWFHQPLHGVHPSSLSEGSAWSQYHGNEKLRPILNKYKDRIVFCGYGHVGVGLTSGTTFSQLDDIEWVNFSMAIPSMAAGGWTEKGVYSIAALNNDDNSIYIERWSIEDAAPLPSHSKSIPLKRPLKLGEPEWVFDGRYNVDPLNAVIRGTVTSYTSAADIRVLQGGNYTLPTGLHHAFKAMVGDDSNDAAYFDVGVGIGFYTQGTTTLTDDQGYSVNAYPAPYILGGEVGFSPISSMQGGRAHRYLVRAADSSGELEDVYEAITGRIGIKGINVLNGGGVRVGRDIDNLNSPTAMGAQLHQNGYVKVSRNSFNAEWKRHTTEGTLHSFVYGENQVGTIGITASRVTFNQTSDAKFKERKGELSFEEAKRIIELITIHNFTWTGDYAGGGDDIGAFAQELYAIYPRAVSVGGWFFEDGSSASEDDEGAVYKPWGVDYSKLIPVILRVVQEFIKQL